MQSACTLHHVKLFLTQRLFRSNKRNASQIIAKRLTRIGKLAGSLGLDPCVVPEVDGNDADDAAEVAGGQIMQHGRGQIMPVALLRTKVLPDGAQYNGMRESLMTFLIALRLSIVPNR